MDDLRVVAARLWDLVGRKPVPTQALVEALYANLRWFPPSQAAHVVAMLQSARLLLPGPSEGTWVAALEVEHLDVPITYRPPSSLGTGSLAPPPKDLLSRIVDATRAPTHEDETKLRAEIDRVAADLGVTPEAAALLVAWRRGLPLSALRDEVDRKLRSGAPAP